MDNCNEIIDKIVIWLKEYLASSGCTGFVIGISGGKDSTVAAALLCKATGSSSVSGIIMPNGEQSDIQDAIDTCNHLGIKYRIININKAYQGLLPEIGNLSPHTLTNIPPRLRMAVLYAIAQEENCLVCGTGNASERYIGYCTKWGDTASDLNPLGEFLTDEVIAIGKALGIPDKLTEKAPADGLTGKTDEDNIGFTYETLNCYIRTGICPEADIKNKIDRMHRISRHKFSSIPVFHRE